MDEVTRHKPICIKILYKALDIISDVERWTQDAEAKDQYDNRTDPYSPDAVKWCSIGAIKQASRGQPWLIQYSAECLLQLNLPAMMTLASFNDQSTHEDVVLAFKTAIYNLESEIAQ